MPTGTAPATSSRPPASFPNTTYISPAYFRIPPYIVPPRMPRGLLPNLFPLAETQYEPLENDFGVDIGLNDFDDASSTFGGQIRISNVVGQGVIFIYGTQELGHRFISGARFALDNMTALNKAVYQAYWLSYRRGNVRKITVLLPKTEDVWSMKTYFVKLREQLYVIFPGVPGMERAYWAYPYTPLVPSAEPYVIHKFWSNANGDVFMDTQKVNLGDLAAGTFRGTDP